MPDDYQKRDPEHKVIYRFIRNLFNAAQLTAECAIVMLVSCLFLGFETLGETVLASYLSRTVSCCWQSRDRTVFSFLFLSFRTYPLSSCQVGQFGLGKLTYNKRTYEDSVRKCTYKISSPVMTAGNNWWKTMRCGELFCGRSVEEEMMVKLEDTWNLALRAQFFFVLFFFNTVAKSVT